MHPSQPDVPAWIQYAIVFASGVAVFAGTLLGYIRKGKAESHNGDMTLVSATFADRRTIEHLVDSLDRHERTLHELCEESRRCRQSMDSNTDAQINLLRFIKGRME
jgi:hypothetical protein